MRGAAVGLALLPVLVLGACHAAGDWSKPSTEASATAREYEDCRGIAETAVKPETGIDQDILATRQAEIGRTSIARVGAKNLRDETRDREDAIIASCMKSKGFAPGGAAAQPRK